jgi:hypothetical protein
MKLSAAIVLGMACSATALVGCMKPPPPQPPVNPFTAAFLAAMQARANGQPFVPPPIMKTALAGATTRILFVQNLNPDCSVRDIPTIRILTAPAHGVEAVKTVDDFGSYLGVPITIGCNKSKIRGAALDYVANADYTGPDTLTYEVIYSNGNDQTTTVKLTVK